MSLVKNEEPLLKVDDLKVHFTLTKGFMQKPAGSVKAVDGVSFELRHGETFGLVGESGCGKSTTALAVLRMQPLTGGLIKFEGNDITQLEPHQMRPLRRRMQMVYQDPFSSLNPRMRIRDIIGEPLLVHSLATDRRSFRARIDELMDMVGLLPDMSDRYPHEFSGGQRQRIGIARALALEPSLIICDEPVSALDVSIQAQVLNLLMDLQRELGLTYLFIAHDLSVVRHISDRIGVMYLGRIVEIAGRDELFASPKHPYTQALLSSIPLPDPALEATRPQQLIVGEVPSPKTPPSGCHFHPRCPKVMSVCSVHSPNLARNQAGSLPNHSDESQVACHLYDASFGREG